MANPQLTVEITAKIDGLRDAFNKAIKENSTFSNNTRKALKQVDDEFAKLANDVEKSMSKAGSATAKASSDITKNLANTAKATAVAGQGVAVGANRAGMALTDLGRIAQDSPFGFIGIQNNINPLIESFGRLKTETGSTGGALKALGQSMIGPAGLGFAISLVSAGILLYQKYQQQANKATENAKKVTDDYIKTLDSVTASQLKGGQNAQREIADLKILYGAYQNANLPLKTRQEAYKQLQEQYPSYFKNLQFEQEAGSATTTAYNSLTQAILATARARAAADKIAQNESRKLENEQKIIDLEKDQINNQKELAKAKARANSQPLSGGSTGGVATNLSDATKAAEIEAKVNENLKIRRQLVTDTNKLDEQSGRLVEYTNVQLEKGAKLTGSIGKERKEIAKEIAKFSGRSLADVGGQQDLGTRLTSTLPTVTSKIKEFVSENQRALATLRYEFGYTDEEIASFISNFGINAQGLLDKTIALNKGVSDVVNNGIISTFGSLAEGIGTALANGASVADAAGQAMLSSLGGVLVQLGQLAIATGVGIKAVQTALKSLNPIVAITAGVALVALGSIFKAKASAIGGSGQSGAQGSSYKPVRGFASGGNNIAGGMALVGERGPELVNLPTGSDVFNNSKTNRILQDSNRGGVVINGSFELGLEELVVRLDQVKKRMDRNGR